MYFHDKDTWITLKLATLQLETSGVSQLYNRSIQRLRHSLATCVYASAISLNNVTAVFCFWTTEQWNGFHVPGNWDLIGKVLSWTQFTVIKIRVAIRNYEWINLRCRKVCVLEHVEFMALDLRDQKFLFTAERRHLWKPLIGSFSSSDTFRFQEVCVAWVED